jgi:uncharacterized protein (DUF305 family)
MTESTLPDEMPAPRNAQVFNLSTILFLSTLALLVALMGFWLGRQSFAPGEDSPEVGFARDMLTHHAQAVDMATILRDRTDDPEMRQLALDIMLTQQGQIGQIQGWLAVWRYPVASTGPAMAWMGMPTSGPMPGMATPEQINQLRALTDLEADVLFLQLMILHHRYGVIMGQAALERVKRPEVHALAQSIVNAQTTEIAAMQDVLQRKGFPPVSDEIPAMDHENKSP